MRKQTTEHPNKQKTWTQKEEREQKKIEGSANSALTKTPLHRDMLFCCPHYLRGNQVCGEKSYMAEIWPKDGDDYNLEIYQTEFGVKSYWWNDRKIAAKKWQKWRKMTFSHSKSRNSRPYFCISTRRMGLNPSIDYSSSCSLFTPTNLIKCLLCIR